MNLLAYLIDWKNDLRPTLFVRETMCRANMTVGIPTTIFAVIMSFVLCFRNYGFIKAYYPPGQISLRVGVTIYLAVSGIAYFAVCVYSYMKKRIFHRAAELANYLFSIACLCFGVYLTVMDYRIQNQMYGFFLAALWVFAMLYEHPVFSSLLWAAAYILLVWRLGAENVLTDSVRQLVMVIGFMMLGVSFHRYYIMLYTAKQEKLLQEQNEHILQQARVDGLTGLWNRHELRARFDSFTGKFLCVLITDIDNFKYFNDTYGHDAGDSVLLEIANRLRQVFGWESCYRYGGDEFLVIVPSRDPEAFRKDCEAWGAGDKRLRLEDGAVRVNCSGGFSYGYVEELSGIRDLIRFADLMLYQVKESGKGRIQGDQFDLQFYREAQKEMDKHRDRFAARDAEEEQIF